MNNKHWILDKDGKTPIQIDGLQEWAKWFETADREIARTEFIQFDKPVSVSTVFLGIDYAFGEGKPILFKTLVFGGSQDGQMSRCCTYEEALVQHGIACGLVVKEGGQATNHSLTDASKPAKESPKPKEFGKFS